MNINDLNTPVLSGDEGHDKAITYTPYRVTIYSHVAHSLGNINAIPQHQRNAQYSRKT